MNLRDKKILVTGSDGFIGSHLVETLLDEGFTVKAFVYYNSNNSWGWLDTLPQNKRDQIEVFAGDIRDPYGTRSAIKDVRLVIHLAALVGIPFSYHSPDSYVDTNIRGTLNILQASRDYEVERVIVTSTSEVYGTAQYVPMDEKHPFQGQSPYSASKIGADRLAESFWRSFGLPITIARPFNTYGPRQSARAVIPTIVTQLLDNKTEIKLGSVTPTRDYTYVKDTCQGFVKLLKSQNTVGEEINISSNSEISIEQLALKIISLINPQARIVVDEERIRPTQSEVMRLFGDNSKMKKLTGWMPRFSLEEGLLETIAWVRQNISQYKTELYTV